MEIIKNVVIPDLWGKSSDLTIVKISWPKMCRNPRFVGQVFRHADLTHLKEELGRNPRFVGQVFRHEVENQLIDALGRNPRFVGQVFRLRRCCCCVYQQQVVIPDLWGKSSDFSSLFHSILSYVVIPDLWGKSSDEIV